MSLDQIGRYLLTRMPLVHVHVTYCALLRDLPMKKAVVHLDAIEVRHEKDLELDQKIAVRLIDSGQKECVSIYQTDDWEMASWKVAVVALEVHWSY